MDSPTRPRRFGLSARVVASFGLAGLALSLLLSLLSYTLIRNNLLDRTEKVALSRVITNAEQLVQRITPESSEEELERLVNSLNTPEGSRPVLMVGERVYSPSALEFAAPEIDPALLLEVRQIDRVASMSYLVNGEPFLVVGIPLPISGKDADYFEGTSRGDVLATLDSLRLTLFGASLLTTMAGIGFGLYASSRLLRPLSEISGAAARIAGGDLSTRISEDPDPDLQQISHSFNDMATALEERIDADARFASEVSHELRSPLMTLTASVAVLERRRDELPERAQIAVDLLSTDIIRFKLLVEDLLEISRYDVGAASLETDPVEIDEFVRQAMALAGHLDVPVTPSPATENLVLSIDKRRLAQAVRNLVENADKYGGGATAVKLTRTGDRVIIAVEDEGPGVPESERKVIFERFSRGSEGGRRGSGTGVGLGLALVDEHVRLHGGEVWVEDRADGKNGSRFVISLPGIIE